LQLTHMRVFQPDIAVRTVSYAGPVPLDHKGAAEHVLGEDDQEYPVFVEVGGFYF
jgi:hypothetical protein